jgi:hypothetical protein
MERIALPEPMILRYQSLHLPNIDSLEMPA